MDDDYWERYVMPIWRNPPQRGTVAPSRAMRPHVEVIDGWQALCAACEELPWTIGPWRSQWIDAALDAWVHNTEGDRHPEPIPIRPLTWAELIEGDTPCPPSLLPERQCPIRHRAS
jgi:hypothetical protein